MSSAVNGWKFFPENNNQIYKSAISATLVFSIQYKPNDQSGSAVLFFKSILFFMSQN